MEPLQGNPFAALTLIAAPAVLTNACSVLTLGTSNRFARAVDRQRQLSTILEKQTHTGDDAADSETAAHRVRQLARTERRAQLLLRGLTSFYVSLGSFAASALISLLGAVGVQAWPASVSLAITVFALLCGMVGVGGVVFGCSLLVRETRIALQGLREEAAFSVAKARAAKAKLEP